VAGQNGKTQKNGRGLFATSFIQQCTLVPVDDEDRLHDARVRENFITRVFAWHRLAQLLNGRLSRKALEEFHTAHKFLLMAHSRKHETALTKLIANAKQFSPSELKRRYSESFMQALTFKTTLKKNAVVLSRMLIILKKSLSEAEKQKLFEAIENYRNGSALLNKAIALIKRHAHKYNVTCLANQAYLNPHPKELMLRNRV
jgi:uncharacterized protein YbgA (DUF1722 family)